MCGMPAPSRAPMTRRRRSPRLMARSRRQHRALWPDTPKQLVSEDQTQHRGLHLLGRVTGVASPHTSARQFTPQLGELVELPELLGDGLPSVDDGLDAL